MLKIIFEFRRARVDPSGSDRRSSRTPAMRPSPNRLSEKRPMENSAQHLLRQLPGVDRLLEVVRRRGALNGVPHVVVANAVRTVLAGLRSRILAAEALEPAEMAESAIADRAQELAAAAMQPNLRRVVNATGIVVHTNLGRSLLCEQAVAHVCEAARHYSNLEYDLAQGRRGTRYSAVESLLCEITGAEAGLAVNNNAGAVLLSLATLAAGREVVVSRGELVEIGGAFRIPDVMSKSGAILREVGTTNRTHAHDYENAIGDATALLLKVHKSNYAITGFTKEVDLASLVALGQRFDLPVMEDLGSGTFVDFSAYGLAAEPTAQASVAAGVQVVTFSGDKLLGGPQAGIIVGRKRYIDRIKRNPLARALRIDKLTLAALESTLRLYRDESQATAQIPTLRMLTDPLPVVQARAARLQDLLSRLDAPRLQAEQTPTTARAGGGALPLLTIPSYAVWIRLEGRSAQYLENALRRQSPPVIGRIVDDRLLLDARTLLEEDLPLIQRTLHHLLEKESS
jgi:L-seryl-tRNA(Ser) seleniumtransferase